MVMATSIVINHVSFRSVLSYCFCKPRQERPQNRISFHGLPLMYEMIHISEGHLHPYSSISLKSCT